MTHRREFLFLSTFGLFGALFSPLAHGRRPKRMYGLIGKMIAVEGERDRLASILLEGISGMPGCLSYVVANDAEDENALWITEVWDRASSHEASLSLPAVRAAIQKGRPLIAGFGERYVTEPLGGQGLADG